MAAEKTGPELVRSLYLLWGHHPEAGRSGLTVEGIVRAGVELADANGLEATSMRKVAERLGVSTMTLYGYVTGKDDLIALMADCAYRNLYGNLDEARSAGDWRAGLRYVAERNWLLYERHPWLLDIHETRLLLGPNASRKYEAELGVLDGIGLSELDMEASLTTLLHLVEGAARAQRADRETRATSGLSDAEWWAIVAPALDYVMKAEEFPVSERVGSAVGAQFNAARDPQHSLRTGIAIVVDGIEKLIQLSRAASGP